MIEALGFQHAFCTGEDSGERKNVARTHGFIERAAPDLRPDGAHRSLASGEFDLSVAELALLCHRCSFGLNGLIESGEPSDLGPQVRDVLDD